MYKKMKLGGASGIGKSAKRVVTAAAGVPLISCACSNVYPAYLASSCRSTAALNMVNSREKPGCILK